MSGQPKGTVFERYSTRRFQTERAGQNTAQVAHADTDNTLLSSQRAEQDAAMPDAPPSLPVVGNESDDEPVEGGLYKAAFLYKSRARPRLRLHYANGIKVKVLSYAYLIEVIATSHQWLTLVFSSTIITLKGRNLDTLVEPLQDERVRALVCYRPGIHPALASSEPCILEIIEKSLNEVANNQYE